MAAGNDIIVPPESSVAFAVNDGRKEIDTCRLGVDNLPGGENRFPGDRDIN